MFLGRHKVAQLPGECGELPDAIGADRIYTERAEHLPVGWIVRGPRHHPRVSGVDATHEILVDQSPLLPEIFGSGFDERGQRVEMTRNFERPGSNRREELFDVVNDPVVEGMHGTVGARFTNAPRHERFDVFSLDLDVHPRPPANRVEHALERRNSDTVREDDLSQLGEREFGDCSTRTLWPATRFDRRIMVHDHHSIARRMHIELYRIRSDLERPQERGDRVFGKGVVRPPVGDALGNLGVGALGQAGLAVVALGTMIAKL